MDLFDKYKGALVGVHVGDALGAPYETWGPKAIAEDLTARNGLCFFDYPNPWATDGNGEMLPAGRPTDDSEQTACLAKCLVERGELDADYLRTLLYESVFVQKSLLWNGRSTGAGRTTRDALHGDPERRRRAEENPIGTNGSLMRAAPMALWFGKGLAEPSHAGAKEFARPLTYAMSMVTHAHRHAKDACWMYVTVLSNAMRGDTKALAVAEADTTSLLSKRVVLRLKDEHCHPIDPGAWPARGEVEFSLYVALYSFLRTSSFAEGIRLAVQVGGDTDTYAAIAGGLLGAYYGYAGIPEEWRKTILGHDPMVEYAKGLYKMRLY